MIDAATIAILATLGIGYTAEGIKIAHDDKKADVYYKYDPDYYNLDFQESIATSCTSCKVCKG